MLLAFSAENARSFREEMHLSLLSTTLSERRFVREIAWREGGKPIGVLPVAGIFGANASGKSNVLRVMHDMRDHVLSSFRHGNPAGGVPRRNFLLDSEPSDRPTRYEIDLVLDGIRHTYGFVFDDQEFIEEWAFRFPRGRSTVMFHRRRGKVELGGESRAKGRAVIELLRPNSLFLSAAGSANHPSLMPLYSWFMRNLRLAEADSRPSRQAFTAQMLEDSESRARVMNLLRAADLGIAGAKPYRPDPETRERIERAIRVLAGEEGEPESEAGTPIEFDELGARLLHEGVAGPIEFDLSDESLGTLVWFGLIGPVVDALAEGSVFLADELDASLHPRLVNQLVRLFQDPKTNSRRAQMIFNSHDATLLGDSSERMLGRDQVWFAEKTRDGSTRLYALSELDTRKSEAVGRRYLAGRYGAVPLLSDQEFDAAAELITVDD